MAVDLGGTRFRVGVIDREGHILAREESETRAEEGPEQGIARLTAVAQHLKAQAPAAAFVGVGVSAPAPLDPKTRRLLWPPNLPTWHGVEIGDLVARAVGLTAYVENDANLGALAEWTWGAGRGLDHVIYITVSTGVGSGVISGGQLIRGQHGLAAEAGHMTIDWEGPPCRCGSNGCLERLASGTWIAADTRARLAAGERSQLATLPPDLVDGAAIAAAARAGDALAQAIYARAARALGVALANLINLFNPQLITLGGGVIEAGDLILEPARKLAMERAMRGFTADLRIERSPLGEHAPLLGAAALVFQQTGR